MDDPRPVHVVSGLNIGGALGAVTLVTSGLALLASANVTGTAVIGASLVVTGPVTGASFSGVGTSLTALNASNLGSGTVPLSRLGVTGTPGASNFFRGDNSWAAAVTSVTVTPANGVSASVSNQGTTPALSFTLGEITPTSVATGDIQASGTVFSVGGFTGPGSGLAGLNASNLGSGTIPLGRLGATGTPDGTKFLSGTNAWATAVTAVTIVTANGVSASVSNQGTTPALTVTLGAITPSSVASAGAVSGTTITASTSFSGPGGSLTGLSATQLTTGTVPLARLGSSGTAGNTTFLKGDNSWATAVTAVTIATANGVSASVANQGTTPAFTITLGAISPSSINSAGNINAATMSSSGLVQFNSLAVTGASSLNTLTVASTLDVTGAFSAAGGVSTTTLQGSSLSVTNNVTIGGTLGVTGVISGPGSGLTALNASNLGSGTVPIARLGSTGTASASTFLAGNNAWTSVVTAVTIVAANGVSATVANQGSTPALTVSLGAITPSSVAATGNVGGATLSSSGLATLNSASITGSASVGGGFTVTGSASFGTLSSSGLASLQSVTTVNGVSVGGALTVTGVATADSFIATGNTVPTVGIYEGASAGGISIATSSTDRFSITSGGQLRITASVVEAVVPLTTSALNCSKGNYFTRTNSAASTWTFTNVPTGFYRMTVRIIRATGAGSQTWPSSVRWSGGTAPTLTTTTGGSDIMEFLTDDGGTTWRAYRIIQTTS